MYSLSFDNQCCFWVHNDTGRKVYGKALTPEVKADLYKAYHDPYHQMNISYGRLCVYDNIMFIEMDEENGGFLKAQLFKIPLTEDNIQTINSLI